MGHEITGNIEMFGADVKPGETDLKLGDFVVVFPWVGCSACSVCLSGNSHMCGSNPAGVFDFGQGHRNPGGYATHVVTRSLDVLLKVPSGIPKELACTLPCSAVTAYCALVKVQSFLQLGIAMHQKANLLIVGAGGLGLWCIQLAKLMFSDAIRIHVADISTDKLENASQYGAHSTVLWKAAYVSDQEFAADVRKTGDNGQLQFDAAIDFVGSQHSFQAAFKNLRKGGTLVAVGLFGGTVNLSVSEIISNNITIQGNRVVSLPQLTDFLEFLEGKHPSYPLLQKFALEDINTVFERLSQGVVKGRAIISFP